MQIKDYFYSQENFELEYISEKKMYKTDIKNINVSDYYASEKYISHQDQSKNLIDRIYHIVKKIALKSKWNLLKKRLPKNAKVLDYGCGTGAFLQVGKQQNFKTFGIEPNAIARKYAQEKNIEVYEKLEDLPNQEFDAITLWHVLEHIPNYSEILDDLLFKLKSGGILILALPNFNSYDAQHYKQHWAAWDVPRHIWHFSKETIKLLSEEKNIELVKIKPMWFDAFYIALLSEKYKTGTTNYFKAFYHGFISNFKGIFSKNFSSQLYILKKR